LTIEKSRRSVMVACWGLLGFTGWGLLGSIKRTFGEIGVPPRQLFVNGGILKTYRHSVSRGYPGVYTPIAPKKKEPEIKEWVAPHD